MRCNTTRGQIDPPKRTEKCVAALESVISFFLERLEKAQAELAKRDADPLREKVEAIVRGMEAISTHSLLDLLGLPKPRATAAGSLRLCAP